ncbi:MAG: aspartate aminotransferase family protein [Peptococcaceae bacterium]|nr:aspartate aminotransferase family protein [Peptococcaceae bacterium]
MKYDNKPTVSDRLREEAFDFKLLEQAKNYALDYMGNILNQPVFPGQEALQRLHAFIEPLQDGPSNPYDILENLHLNGSPCTVAQTGGRYFGFVNGGIVPVALAAKWLSDSWDQNAGLYVISPIASVLEDVCEKWLVDLLHLPSETAAGFVGGSSTATLCGLAAGRNYLLEQQGYDVAKKGLFGAPEIRVILGEGAHSTVYKALSILGLGSERLLKIPADNQGRILTEAVPELDNRTLLILQAGNVNTGAFDDFSALCRKAKDAGCWIHVDGAFGLWAAASQELGYLVRDVDLADSWSVDGHKTLNTPYDQGIILCRKRDALTQALHMTGSYIIYSNHRDGMLYTPDMSRRARSVELWATLKSLGKKGVSELVEDLHHKAVYFAERLAENGFTIHNKVWFNQVLASLEHSELTGKMLSLIQSSKECWCGGAKWGNHSVIRISVCSYRTTYGDIDRSVNTFIEAREKVLGDTPQQI